MENQNKPAPPPDDFDTRRQRWHRRGGASPIFPGLILVLLGVLFLLANQGIIGWGEWWQYFLIGLGGIFLVEAAIRGGQGDNRGYGTGRIITGIVLIGIGVLFLAGLTTWWPLILIGAGIAIIAVGLLRHGK
jgi:hypothetical protein